MKTRNLLLCLLCAAVASLSACDRDKKNEVTVTADQASPAPPPPAATTVPPPPPVSMPTAGEAVDTCAMLSKADAEGVMGPLAGEPTAQTAQGSLLGMCTYTGNNGTLLTVSARPASEYDATVQFSSQDGKGTPAPEFGSKATQTPAGLMIQPDGKPFFLVVFAVRGASGQDQALEKSAAKKLNYAAAGSASTGSSMGGTTGGTMGSTTGSSTSGTTGGSTSLSAESPATEPTP